MKLNHIVLATMLIPALFATSCLDNGDDTIVLQSEKLEAGIEARVVSTSQAATIRNNGYVIHVPMNAVPKGNSGADGKVAFSISPVSELPAELPSGMSYVNNTCIKIEPMNFVFDSPLTIEIPTKGINPSELVLLRYNEYTGEWENIPFSVVNEDGTIEVSVIELGIFVVARVSDIYNYGGIRIARTQLDPDYVYYLTIISSDNNAAKRISYSDNGKDLYMSNIPLGEYSICVTRQRRNGLNNATSGIEYHPNQTIRVKTKLVKGSGGYDSYTGWTNVNLGSSTWYSGRPDAWGEATKTYGTGAFQATLTWVNTSSSSTDVDLHLVGPDFHVYFGSKNSECFELDRDWLREYGNAVENIYSINDHFAKGSYRVYVNHYSGDLGKRYNCRIIMNGVVVKSTSGKLVTDDENQEIYTFEID